MMAFCFNIEHADGFPNCQGGSDQKLGQSKLNSSAAAFVLYKHLFLFLSMFSIIFFFSYYC